MPPLTRFVKAVVRLAVAHDGMQRDFDTPFRAGYQAQTTMRSIGLPLCLAVAISTFISGGCKRRPTPGDGASSEQGAPNGAVPVVPATPAGEIGLTTKVVPNSPQAQAVSAMNRDLQSGNPQLVLARLNELLDAWEMSGKPRPNSPDDLVKGGMLTKAPVPPAGKRYAINPKSGRFELAAP